MSFCHQTTRRIHLKLPSKGTKEGESRATFIVSKDDLERIKALAWANRKTIKEVLGDALNTYFQSKTPKINKALKAYRAAL